MNRLLLSSALALACGPVGALDVSDDRGKTVAMPGPAARIVALAPHLAEIAFAAGAGARLAGVSSHSEFPEEAMRLPVVATHGRIDLERILRAKPEAVLAWMSGNPAREIERLEQRGLSVIVTEVRRLDDIPRLVRLVGRIAGTSRSAEQKAGALEEAIAGLPRGGANAVSVFVEVWHEPLMTVNGEHLISTAVRACGGRNVFESAPVLTPSVSREQLLKSQPQAVIMNAAPGGEQAALSRWRRLPIPASRTGRLYAIDPRLIHALGPRFIEAARTLCAQLERVRAMAAPQPFPGRGGG